MSDKYTKIKTSNKNKHKKEKLRHELNEALIVNNNDNNPLNSKKTLSSKPTVDCGALAKSQCEVSASKLIRHTDPNALPESTEFSTELPIGFGQPRAIQAIKTAFDIKASGYHIFAVGENGLGKRTFITNYLKSLGKPQTDLRDWIYVHNFDNPLSPIAISVKKNSAKALASNMLEIWQTLQQSLNKHLQKVLFNNDFTTKGDLKPANSDIQLNQIESIHSDLKQIAKEVLEPLFQTLNSNHSESHADSYKLSNHLTKVMRHMIDHAYDIATNVRHLYQDSNQLANTDINSYASFSSRITLLPPEYSINVISCSPENKRDAKKLHKTDASESHYVSTSYNATVEGAPIVFAHTPNVLNLMGHIEYATQSGSVVTDVRMIRSGALHKANGGYLLIEANRLLKNPNAWHELKRSLQLKKIEFTSFHQSAQPKLVSLTPEPIPLNVKVILLGDMDSYDKFIELDDEFRAVFKIRAEFHDHVDRNHANELAMVAKMADVISKHRLLAFDNSAQAVILDNLSLQVEDQNKLSLHVDRLMQLMLEANRHAELNQSNYVKAIHVKQALTDIEYRSSYLKELYWQELTDGQQLINTSGKAIGQINALTVIDYADIEFGMPARLTAVVQHSMGSGDILDIERDVELGGSLHAKGMLIMNSYLRALFSPFHPLNFTASLAFEQSYAHIDGDSATLAEACALLSALADVPISQSLAITGSMNQLGMVQAVGGVNAKISGFFDVCRHQGLTGTQGVILPAANISQLMLRDDIIEAVKRKQFHIYGVQTLSDALTILSEIPIDTVTKKGRYRKSSLFGKVIKNLKKWDEQLNPTEEIEVTPKEAETIVVKNSDSEVKK